MPSPFPGMDPFLEEPAGWPGFHTRLVTAIGDDLAAALTPRYHVRIEERVYLTDPDADPGYGSFVPDVSVTGSGGKALPGPAGPKITEPVLLAELFDDEIHDRYLEIRDARSEEVVTAIEVLSPANKVPGSRGREKLAEKRRQILAAGANWLEIDLIRAGQRTPRMAGRSEYCVLLLRAGHRGALAWPIRLRDALPTVLIPLRKPDEGAPLDLARIVAGCYERGRYEDTLDYGAAVPLPPLGSDDTEWVSERISAWRMRRG